MIYFTAWLRSGGRCSSESAAPGQAQDAINRFAPWRMRSRTFAMPEYAIHAALLPTEF